MHLSTGKTSLDLTVAAYQFPEITQEPYDANWLLIAGTATHRGRTWTFQDACLLTWELAELADWLDELATERICGAEIQFREPNLSFTSPSFERLIVTLAYEIAPPTAEGKLLNPGVHLEFAVTGETLRTAALAWRAELERFPIRGDC